MSCISAVSIHDDLTSCQACITVRSTDDETTCRIDKIFGICIQKFLWQDRIKYIFFDILMDPFLRYVRVMLCGKYNCFQAERLSVFIIFYGNLALAIRAEVRQCAILTNLCKLTRQLVCQTDRIWHIFFCFVCCITKHHTLIACTDSFQLLVRHFIFLSFKCLVNTHSDICRLLIQCYHNCAGICIEADLTAVITDLIYSFTYDLLYIQMCLCCDLTCYQYKTCTAACFTCHTAHRILLHAGIQNGIGNGIADFVRMSFCNRF